MKVLISADMEGVCGVTSWAQVVPPEYGSGPGSTVEYERARARLTREVNAAVEGALAAGADEVIVNEAHDGMRNLLPEDLHEGVRFMLLGEQVVGVVVKEGYTTFSAIHLHPLRAQGRIREGAERAVRQAARASPWRLPPDCRVEIDFDHQARAQACLFVPGIERAGDRTVAFTARDALSLNDTFTALMTASAVTFSP
jgi:D-aminopeptidase